MRTRKRIIRSLTNKRRIFPKHRNKNYTKKKNTSNKYTKRFRLDSQQDNFKKTYDKMIKLQCSPAQQKKSYSCLSDDAIYKLKELWNIRHPDEKIITTIPREIWERIKEKMQSVCNKESCWLKQKFVSGKLDDELKNSFAPASPKDWKKNPNEWLSSVDITNVMKQYEKAYKCYEFIGPSPIDYDTIQMYGECVWEELCHFDLEKQIRNGKTKIGVIFNLDPHYKSGSHWVSLFVNIKKGEIFYFDSTGDYIPRQIKKFVDKVISDGKKLSHPIIFKFDQNHPVEHQYGNTECGVYSIFFITHMLEDKITEHYLKTHVLKDKYMEKFRKKYFNEDL